MPVGKCIECGDTRPIKSRQCCYDCYKRLWRAGRVNTHPKVKGTRFATWLAAQTAGDHCWVWPYCTKRGYGTYGNNQSAHRRTWETLVGAIPEGMTLDHECHNRAAARGECKGGATCVHRRCCNPAHLVVRTVADNTRRSLSPSALNARKTHCAKAGHPLSGDNLYINPKGQRCCKECQRNSQRAFKERQRLAATS